jgi:hypothetical protein
MLRSLEPIGFTAEISKPGRGLGTDDVDPDEFYRFRKLFVAPIETSLLQMLTDSGKFGGEITHGEGRVNVFDYQIQAVERIEAYFRHAENLHVGFYSVTGCLPEPACDRLCSIPPNDALHLGENVTPLIARSQGEIEVSVLAK